jgi:hypothetical protein
MICRLCKQPIANSEEVTFLGEGVVVYNQDKYTILCNVCDFTNIVHRACYQDNNNHFYVWRD